MKALHLSVALMTYFHDESAPPLMLSKHCFGRLIQNRMLVLATILDCVNVPMS